MSKPSDPKVPELVGKVLTRSVHIPTIGIGAGAGTSGQVLVFHDMLGYLDHPLRPMVRRRRRGFLLETCLIL